MRILVILALCLFVIPSCSDLGSPGTQSHKTENNETPAGNDDNINELIKECVSVKADYSDYAWHFRIESSLHKKLPDYTIRFGIGHGDVDGETLVSVESQAYKYSVSTSDDKKTMIFENPFWFYYIFGEGSEKTNAKEISTECEMYYESYVILNEKGTDNLSGDELQLYRDICKYLNSAENEADLYYSPSVEIQIEELGTFYKAGVYRR